MTSRPLSIPACDREHCITCSDEGVPMRVVEPSADGMLAVCEDVEGRRSDVLTGVVGPVAAGDLLLVHAGAALTRLTAAEEGV